MNPKTTLPISEARKRIFDIAEDVQKPGRYYTFTEKGHRKAILMSAQQFDSIMEDLELLSDPRLSARMAAVEKEFEKGEFQSWDEVKKELGLDRLKPALLMDKSRKSYQRKSKNPRK